MTWTCHSNLSYNKEQKGQHMSEDYPNLNNKPPKYTARVIVLLTHEQRAKVWARAERTGKSASEVMRNAIDKEISAER